MKKKTKVLIIISSIVLLMIAIFIWGIVSIKHYTDTHTWVTLRIVETVNADTNDLFEQSVEFLKNDTLSLHATVITVEDVTHDGTATISFSPAVINSSTGEEFSTVTLKYSEAISFEEVCNDTGCKFKIPIKR